MAKMILERVRDRLRTAGIVSSDKQFCELWLGKSECYLRGLRFNASDPSADVLAICAVRLADVARQLREYGEERHIAWADELEALCAQCYAVMNAQALKKLQRKGVCV